MVEKKREPSHSLVYNNQLHIRPKTLPCHLPGLSWRLHLCIAVTFTRAIQSIKVFFKIRNRLNEYTLTSHKNGYTFNPLNALGGAMIPLW